MADAPPEREPDPALTGTELDERERRAALLFMLEDLQASRAQIERARKEWADAFDAIRDPIFLHDKDFRIVRANRAYAKAAGMAIKDVIGKRYWEVFPKNEGPLPACARHMEKAEEEEEEEMTLPTGEVFVSRGFAIRDDEGRYVHSIHILEDITEKRRSAERLKETLTDTIRAIALTVEKRDPYTAGHQNKVAELCVAIGRELGLDESRLEGLRLGATIHDIGKVYIPAEILNRPGKLSKAEFEMIQTHPEVGYDIVKDVKFPWPVGEMIFQHHERLDGSGYPKGLKGDAIVLEARILAVADVVEAMSSHRPYRPAIGPDKALAEIEQHRGMLYDTAVADACLKLFRERGFRFD
ncbi:MAG: hypothetical protein A2V91_07060 [Candidatus Muproteobacteria bacterium RBG_16_64_10]|uniref:PAS domain S-box protein n=1 Tax=Candidatus Muproteobacteria bacterium RBG_16_64_10 TaxID=1817757 RepID=A0A1F6SWI9_9PROT|nr:MAG: hypothetical protein A2V91_07060 [Candidatus Muproteobacteria bacterium RBG_16_64_10]